MSRPTAPARSRRSQPARRRGREGRASWGLTRTTGKEPSMEAMRADEIRVALREYLEGRMTLHAFEDWFVSHTWNVRQFAHPSLNDLVYEVELRLAEYTNGHR